MADPSLDAAQIETLLDDILWSQGASKRAAALSLAGLPRSSQDWVIRWVRALEPDNTSCANQLLTHARAALEALDASALEAWLLHALDIYDQAGLYAAVEIFRYPDRYQERARMAAVGISLDQVSGVVQRLVLGLSGRPLRISAGAETHTDTETLFLPAELAPFEQRDDNFRLLKVSAAYLWAQTRFGTWRPEVLAALASFPDPAAALYLFEALERLRLSARIAQDLPGIHRDMCRLEQLTRQPPLDPHWTSLGQRLAAPNARVQDSLALLDPLLAQQAQVPAPTCFQGRLFPDRVEPVLRARLEDERRGLRSLLVRLRSELDSKQPAAAQPPHRDEAFQIRPTPDRDPAHPEQLEQLELWIDDLPVTPPPDVRQLLTSIWLDLGEIPPEYLVPAGDGTYQPRTQGPEPDAGAEVWSGTYHERGAFLYDEWDYRRRNYRKSWCVLRELPLEAKSGQFVAQTLAKYSRHLDSLRKTFEALRGEDKRLRKEPHGDEIDLDALVEARADAARGLEMSERLFSRRDKVERNIAVLFMVDMSGSTRGWINDAERESLILLCEALETLGDRYAIHGFSGMTRKRCELFKIKDFDEAYDREIQGRIEAIEPRDYTRMGPPIRHLTRLLNQVEAKTRVLITLSDGKPDDYSDEYRGDYGIEDTRRALLEARRSGIHPFCITIDRQAAGYLPHLYGAANYTIVDRVEQLPFKVSDIYRRLTR